MTCVVGHGRGVWTARNYYFWVSSSSSSFVVVVVVVVFFEEIDWKIDCLVSERDANFCGVDSDCGAVFGLCFWWMAF